MKTMDIFKHVGKHLLTQNEQSLVDRDTDRSCAYRGDGGLKCAVGCLITDEAYDPAIEGQGVLLDDGVHMVWRRA